MGIVMRRKFYASRFCATLVSLSVINILMAGSALASTKTGSVDKIYIRSSDGLVYVELTGESTKKPLCAQNHSYYMIKDENSGTGKRQLALLMLAVATGKKVTIYGNDSCTRWGDGEDIDQVIIENI
jgi:hypothetical protein